MYSDEELLRQEILRLDNFKANLEEEKKYLTELISVLNKQNERILSKENQIIKQINVIKNLESKIKEKVK